MGGDEPFVASISVILMFSSLGRSLPWLCLAMLDLELTLELGRQYFHFLTCALCPNKYK